MCHIAGSAAKAGADIIQYRDKISNSAEMIRIAKKIRSAVRRYKVLFIINDRLDVALAAGADGVHLGQGDADCGLGRLLGGSGFMIGRSASTMAHAKKAMRDGADYIGAGPVFATPIKKSKKVISPSTLAGIRAVGLPVMFIGGINRTTAPRLFYGGINHIAVIRAVSSSHDPYTAVKELKAAIR